MTIELMQTLSTLGYVLAGVFLLIAIILFIILKIPAVIGDLSGATARKAIENIRQQNEMSETERTRLSSPNGQNNNSHGGKTTITSQFSTVKLSTTQTDEKDNRTTLLERTSQVNPVDRKEEMTTLLNQLDEPADVTSILNLNGDPITPDSSQENNKTIESVKASIKVEAEVYFAVCNELIE